MSMRARKFFPNYQLHVDSASFRGEAITFSHEGMLFVTKLPLFGATGTEKVALQWAAVHLTPPVACLWYNLSTTADRPAFRDPDENHRFFSPYAMTIVTLQCLGEASVRMIKIYYCDIEVHEDYLEYHNHTRSKGVYIVPAT